MAQAKQAARRAKPVAKRTTTRPTTKRRPVRKEIESYDPATGELIGTVPVTAPGKVEEVAEEVARIQEGWALTPINERQRVMERAAKILLRQADDVGLLVTREHGKTVVESAIVDVAQTSLVLDWLARYAERYLAPERIPNPQAVVKHKRHWVLHRPLGVVGIIGPWNYPLAIPMGQVAFALVAGNGVVLKPSEHTPLVGDEVARIFAEAGVPDGLLRVVHGYGETGAALCEAGPVRKVFFTGSTATGMKVMQAAAKHGKPAALELGGKDPAIVCADADLDRAVAGTCWAGFFNEGQTCVSVERVYVDRKIYDEFVTRLIDRAKRMKPGDPKSPETDIGPMNNDMQYEKVVAQLDEAREQGATVECGGPVEVPGFSGKFIAPAVLTGVDHSMTVMKEETFGPVIPVMPVDSEQEAVRLANDTPYGLGASVWSRNVKRARMIAEQIDAGMVWINDHAYTHSLAQTPWGGVKESGVGVKYSKHGLYEMVQLRLIAEDSGRMPAAYWYPYDEVKRRGFLAAVDLLTSSGADKLRAVRERRGDLGGLVRQLLGRNGT
jgi:succinate-semialdehyde dehydrogenase/glutarate-semialdehyde dehydrogenase